MLSWTSILVFQRESDRPHCQTPQQRWSCYHISIKRIWDAIDNSRDEKLRKVSSNVCLYSRIFWPLINTTIGTNFWELLASSKRDARAHFLWCSNDRLAAIDVLARHSGHRKLCKSKVEVSEQRPPVCVVLCSLTTTTDSALIVLIAPGAIA